MILPRSISYRRYAVSGKIPDPREPEFAAALSRHAFLPLADDSPEQEATGWTDFSNFLDLHPAVDALYLRGVMHLALRFDKVAIPASLVKAHLEMERRAFVAVGGERLDKAKLAEMRDGVLAMLRPRFQPKTQVVKGLWFVRDKMLYLLTTAESPAERFAQHFARTFDERRLLMLEPAALVGQLGATRPKLSQVDLVEPADFRRPADRHSVRRAAPSEEDG